MFLILQLADTDGSSTIPPSVHRVLNSKACRGIVKHLDCCLALTFSWWGMELQWFHTSSFWLQQLVPLCRGNYVWRHIAAFRMFPDCRRAETNFTLFPGKLMLYRNSRLPPLSRFCLCVHKFIPSAFQCAHGRPTTVPLVNLDLLHNKVARLGLDESWHGLRQHKLSLKRTSQRLRSAVS